MKFAPKPENDFAEYIRTYYDECRYRFDGIEAIAGKWMFRDLMPGMSDFDTRFITRDSMTPDDWCRMSTAVGEAHLSLCRRYSCWARNLEHLPGINLTWAELTAEETYYPEFKQWTFYNSERPSLVSAAQEALSNRPWDLKDEYFHLKKFCHYFGRYDREIDPPCNMSVHENKYPLHSRLMHYFSPPVMSALSIIEKRSIAGKLDAFEVAERRFPRLECWGIVREILHANYETPKWYREPAVSRLEDALESALTIIAQSLPHESSILPSGVGPDPHSWTTVLQDVPVDPRVLIFENAKFARLMKGRLTFYANAPECFDASWPLENELRRIGNNFFRVPFRTFWRIETGQNVDDPSGILAELKGMLLNDAEYEATKQFARLACGPREPAGNRETALAIAGIFDDFYKGLAKICGAVQCPDQ